MIRSTPNSFLWVTTLCAGLISCGGDATQTDTTWPGGSDGVAPNGSTDPGVSPVDGVNPAGTSPSNNVSPADPNNPVSPVDPNNPVSPADPNNPVSPADPNNPVSPADPNTVSPSDPVKAPTLAACEQPAIGSPVLRLLTGFEFRNTINDVFPTIAGQWSDSLPSNSVGSTGFDNDAAAVMGGQMTEALTNTAESIGSAVSASLSSLLPCSAAAADRACAAEFVTSYGKRLFRRPLTEAEQNRYLALFDTAIAQTDFPTAMKWITAGLVQSPNTFYRSELGAVAGDGTRTLTQHEIATQLAYTFTGSPPSDALLAQADAGTLTDLEGTAKALLQTEQGRNTLHRFFEAYAGYPITATKQKPNASTNGVGFNQVSTDMVQETRAFIEDVVFNQGGSFQDLLTSTQTNPSQQLANFYGLPAPSGDFSAVERPAGQGVGLLAQGAFLASHANSDASSPTQRGVFTYTKVLCQPKPPLPDNVPQLGNSEPGVRTTRQRYEEVHAADPACAGCHALFDPIGYAFEHFDEAGRYRADENGLPIDPTGYLTSRNGERKEFASQEDLSANLASLPEVQECFAAYLATYAFGSSEACLGTSQVPAMQTGSLSIVDAFASLATEPHFTKRAAQ